MKKLIPIIALIAVLYSCKNEDQSQFQGPAEYEVVEVAQRTITVFDEYQANIRGTNNNDVRAKIQGYINKVYVDEGQQVRAGTPLFRLETNILSQSADAAREAVNASQSNIVAAEAAVKVAQVEVDKLKPLVEKGIIGEVQLETALANLNRAQASLAQAKAAKGQAESSLKGIQENINFSVVRSPITGIVGTLPFREGSLVGPGDPTPLTTVSQIGSVYAYFSMNEKEYLDFLESAPGLTVKEKLSNIPPVELILANGQAYSEKGKIEAATGQIDPATGSIQFRATFANQNGLLTNGNSGRIRIPKVYENAVVFPQMASFERQGFDYVYRVAQDTATQTQVNVKAKANNLILVESGLKPGDQVVLRGTASLRDGTPIKPKKEDLDQVLKDLTVVF